MFRVNLGDEVENLAVLMVCIKKNLDGNIAPVYQSMTYRQLARGRNVGRHVNGFTLTLDGKQTAPPTPSDATNPALVGEITSLDMAERFIREALILQGRPVSLKTIRQNMSYAIRAAGRALKEKNK